MNEGIYRLFQGSVDQVNVSFFPGAAGAFIGLPPPELVNRMASPDDVWPHDFRDAVAALQPLPTEQRISGLADLLLARLEPLRGAAPADSRGGPADPGTPRPGDGAMAGRPGEPQHQPA